MDVSFKYLVTLLVTLSLLGCTAMQPVATQEIKLTDKIEVGDHVIIYEHGGRVLDFNVAYIDELTIRGTSVTNVSEVYEVNIRDINKIEVEGVEVFRTAGLVLGAIILLPIMALGAGMSAGNY